MWDVGSSARTLARMFSTPPYPHTSTTEQCINLNIELRFDRNLDMFPELLVRQGRLDPLLDELVDLLGCTANEAPGVE